MSFSSFGLPSVCFVIRLGLGHIIRLIILDLTILRLMFFLLLDRARAAHSSGYAEFRQDPELKCEVEYEKSEKPECVHLKLFHTF